MSSYGEAKKRDMMRSILPSTRRKGARDDLAHIRRNNRHHINQHLAEFRGPSSGAIEHYEYGDYDLNHYPDGEIKWAVWERRAADKVAPIIRWAQQITKDLPQKEDRTWLERTYGERSYWDPKRKERYIWVYVRRPLLGMHDIDDFLKEFVPFEMIEHPVSGRIIRSPSRVWGIRRKFEVLDEILKELGV
jgi:hypothetical protein